MAILRVEALKDGEDEDNEILALDSTALTTFYPIARANPDQVIVDLEAAGGITSAYPAFGPATPISGSFC